VTRGWRALAGTLATLACTLCLAAPDATSADGRWRVEGRDGAVLVFDAGQLAKSLPARRLGGSESAAVIAVHHLPQRRSFVIAFDTLPELWELSVDPQAAPIFDGLVHDYRMGEAIATPGFLGARRTPLTSPSQALRLDPQHSAQVMVQLADGWWVFNLDVRRPIARVQPGREPAPDRQGVR
jgi:hypothetical protein